MTSREYKSNCMGTSVFDYSRFIVTSALKAFSLYHQTLTVVRLSLGYLYI
jgi:hypothetical protein